MSLRFIYGSASYDHDHGILKQIKDQMDDDRSSKANNYYFYLVPNHIKFKSEVNTLKDLNKGLNTNPVDDCAQINVQILSFTRLAWFFMSRIIWKQPQQLRDSGINMLLYKIISQEKDLKVFQTEADQPGFISKLANQISEMKTGQITPDDLSKDLQASNQSSQNHPVWNPDLQRKMHDFVKIYHDFEAQTQDRYLGKADVLTNLSHFIKAGKIKLDNYHFYLSGFSQFTAQESELVKQLILHAASVTIDLDLDEKVHKGLPQKLPRKPNLFYKPALLYQRLCNFAKDNEIHVIVDKPVKKQRVTDDLKHLDQFWSTVCRSHNQIKPKKLNDSKSIQVIQAPNRYAELSKVALMIRQMVATGKYRYSDFIIMTRHLDKFKNVIRPIFKAQQVPIFVDLQKSMDSHPLVQLLDSLFSIYKFDPSKDEKELINNSYQYADVMNLLKTELLLPKKDNGNFMDLHEFRKDLSLTENWVLKMGYRGSEWIKSDDWKVYNYNDVSDFGKKLTVNQDLTKRINVIHQFIRKTLPPFYKDMQNAKTGLQAATILYDFLINNGVLDRLKIWRQNDANPDDKKNNDITAANEIGQVWKVFCQLLDDFVSILGNQKFDLNHFLNLLRAGFEGSMYSQIPSTLDQVIISESRIVQTDDYKVAFMIGSTDEVMPDKITNDSLFNDEDRTEISPYLKPGIQYLNDDSTSQMDNEPFLNYLAFMSATQRIIFTYSVNNEDDKDKKVQISPYVKLIANHFQIQPVQVPLAATATAKHENAAQANDVINFVGSPEATLRHLVQAACDSNRHSEDNLKRSIQMDPAWYYLYAQLNQDNSLTDKLLGGLDYSNQPKHPLRPMITTKLYGPNLNTSISQLEQFYHDPYEYFLKYGLRLQPRKVFGLNPINIGRFYHKLMEDFVKNINLRQIDLKQLTPKQIQSLIDSITERLLDDPRQPQYQVLTSSHRMDFLKNHMMHTVDRMLMTMHQQSNYTDMRPFRAEIPFGVGKQLDVPRFTAGSHHINIEGRIDRIDAMKLNDQGFFSVVDYKSSKHHFDYGPMFYGDEMQMMTYLDILDYNLKQNNVRLPKSIVDSKVAGVLYAWIHMPKLKPEEAIRNVKLGILKSQRYHDALLVDDPGMLKHLDSSLKPSSNSLIYPIRRNKNGYSPKNLIKPKDLKLILHHTQDLIVNAGQKIYKGDIDLKPMRFNKQSYIQTSPYKPIMQFDPKLGMDDYNNIPKMNISQLISSIKSESQNH